MNRRATIVGLLVLVATTLVVIVMLLLAPVPTVDDEPETEPEEVAVPEPAVEPLRRQVAGASADPEPIRHRRARAERNVLSGRVTSTSGAPLAAELVLAGPGIRGHRRVRTDPDGRFRIARLPRTALQVSVRAPGYRPHLARDLVVRGLVRRKFILEPVVGVTGRVLDPQGRPARGAFVQMAWRGGQRTVQADSHGGFSWDRPGVDLATLTVIAYSPWHAASQRLPVEVGKPVELHLGEGATISGQVVDSRGEPVAHAAVAVQRCVGEPDHDFDQRWWPMVRTDARGAFRIVRIRPGRCDLSADSDRHGPGRVSDIWTSAGATTDDITITLGSGGVVYGRITARGDGRPIARAGVVVFEPGSRLPPAHAATDQDGNYRLEGVGPGLHSVRVTHRDYLTELRGGLRVPEGSELRRDLTLRPRKPGERFAFEGIGATLGRNRSGVLIRDTMQGSPAAEAGLSAGDVIVGVDHEPSTGMSLGQVVERIRGRAGVPVVLEIDRPGRGRLTVTVERGNVVVKDRPWPHRLPKGHPQSKGHPK